MGSDHTQPLCKLVLSDLKDAPPLESESLSDYDAWTRRVIDFWTSQSQLQSTPEFALLTQRLKETLDSTASSTVHLPNMPVALSSSSEPHTRGALEALLEFAVAHPQVSCVPLDDVHTHTHTQANSAIWSKLLTPHVMASISSSDTLNLSTILSVSRAFSHQVRATGE